MSDITLKGNLWWPTLDYHCKQACDAAHNDILHVINFCKQKRSVIQAGGNVGVWPIELSKHFQKIFTVEPDETNFACLSKNVENIPNIYPIKCGLSDKSELVDLHREFDNCGAYYVEGNGDVRLITIDSLNVTDCDLIQLDIEGYEHKALLGGLETIKAYKPVIVCEEKGLGIKYGSNNGAIANLLLEYGYKISDKISNDVVYTI